MKHEDSRFIRKAALRERFGLTDPQIRRLILSGALPAPIYFGPRSPRWRASDLDEFERRAMAGELATAEEAAAMTAAARETYLERAASGKIAEKRQNTARRAKAAA